MRFRMLDKREREEFTQYARENPITDAELASGKWDICHPVCRQVWVEMGLASEVGKASYVPSIVGYVFRLTGEILCRDCAEGFTEITPLFDINIAPYTQDCHECGDVIWFGESELVLFPKKDEL